MKSLTKSLSLAFLTAFVLFSCKPDTVAPKDNSANNGSPSLQADALGPHRNLEEICSPIIDLDLAQAGSTLNGATGTPWAQSVKMMNGQDINGEDLFEISYQLQYGWYANKQEVYIGKMSDLTFAPNGIPVIDARWITDDINPVVNSWPFQVAATNFTDCDVVLAKITIGQISPWSADPNQFLPGTENVVWLYNTKWDDGNNPQMNSTNGLITPWCNVPCTAPQVCTLDFTTFNQCGYGVCGQDGIGGTVREQLFASAFPAGLQLGCATGYTMTLSSAQAANNFLPSKGGKILTSNLTDPNGKFKNPNENICPGFAPSESFEVDFDTDGLTGGNGAPLAKGTFITTQYDEVGLTISGVSNHGNRTGDVIIFDSSNPTGGDSDLGTPNQAYGGPGIGNGGTNPAGRNDQSLGNVIILAENVRDNNNDGRVDNPDDDAAGGIIYFDFNQPISVEGLDMLDLDDHADNEIIFQFADGTTQMWECPQIGNNSHKFVSTLINGEAAHNVARISVSFSGSGAIAGLKLSRPGNLSNACYPGITGGFASTLAGRLATAKMNVKFDEIDPNLGNADFAFGNLLIRNGVFAGLSVNELIEEADKVLGGCSTTYTKGQINGALKKINNSFRDGVKQNNYLTCP